MMCTLCEYMGYSAITLANCPNCLQKGFMVMFDRWRAQKFAGLSRTERERLTQERNKVGIIGRERRDAYVAGELTDDPVVTLLANAAAMAEHMRSDKVKKEAVEMLQRDKQERERERKMLFSKI